MTSSIPGSFLRFGDKVARVLDDGTYKIRTLSALPYDTAALRELTKDVSEAVPEPLLKSLRSLAAAEHHYLSNGGMDSIVVREGTKLVLAELSTEAGALIRTAGSPSLSVDRFGDQFGEMRKLIAIRMEVGDASKQADERSIRIQDRIERAEHKVAVMKEALTTSRENRTKEMIDIAAQIARLKKEVDEVKAKGGENEETLRAFTAHQTGSLSSTHETKSSELHADLVKVHTEFAKAAEANETAATNLRKKRNHLRTEYSRVLADYDRDMVEVTEKIEKIKEIIAKEKTQLEILQRHFVFVDLNNKAAAEEAEAYRKKCDQRKAARERRVLPAVRKVQRWYRKILELRAYEKKKNKAKGKGGKKKK